MPHAGRGAAARRSLNVPERCACRHIPFDYTRRKEPPSRVPMTTPPSAPSGDTAELSWLDGGGEAGALIRAFDWTTTGLGHIEGWPQSLRTVTGMLLLS